MSYELNGAKYEHWCCARFKRPFLRRGMQRCPDLGIRPTLLSTLNRNRNIAISSFLLLRLARSHFCHSISLPPRPSLLFHRLYCSSSHLLRTFPVFLYYSFIPLSFIFFSSVNNLVNAKLMSRYMRAKKRERERKREYKKKKN